MAEMIRDVRAGQPSFRFYTGEFPSDDAVHGVDHTPNGYFWEGVLTYLDPSLAASLEMDSEAGMFAVYGTNDQLQHAQGHLEPLVMSTDAIVDVIRRAEAEGFEFDD